MILTRIIILERPPVSTLYESVLFVALIAALLGALMDRGKTSHEGKLIASLLGAFLMGISGIFAVGADTLGVVIAVLNTDFWLATHVITITAGYGIALVAGTLAHVYLIKPEDKRYKQLHTIALIALLFTAIGTILGGIWADQSWGRFWGWDPKENGALLIVIWLVWVLHGLITGHLKPIWFACLLAFTNIIVALSWFGVNLLNVGLHSYGFTDSAAYGLLAFCITELVLITSFTLYAKRHAR
jgi:ABC-type transport system involved in cytochrome c biogenesis permease subunit